VAVDSTGKLAFVTNYSSNNVSVYTIDANSGALAPVAGSPFGAGTAPFGIATCRVKNGTCKPPAM
jgi:DNA-binding beta-propeller fold protein YncE